MVKKNPAADSAGLMIMDRIDYVDSLLCLMQRIIKYHINKVDAFQIC